MRLSLDASSYYVGVVPIPLTSELAAILPYFPEVEAALCRWVPDQRWYASKGRGGELRIVAGSTLPSPQIENQLAVLLIRCDFPDDESELYQVPVALRRDRSADSGYISSVGAESDRWHVYDGPQDMAYTSALLTALQGSASTAIGESAGLTIEPHSIGKAAPTPEVVTSGILKGEQSNTSIIYQLRDADGTNLNPLICKVFRLLHAGENPDVVLQSGLWEAGCDRVPRPIGYLSGEWMDVVGHLAFMQEFLPGVEDAWRVALGAVAADSDFSEKAYALGAATAQVHATLADCFPTVPASDELVTSVLVSIQRRREVAEAIAPQLLEVQSELDRILATAADAPWPTLQRIHGDYHLGQVLWSNEYGWILVDFEGEPARPMAERSEPDLALRDIAGMLRSFDYAVGSHYHETHAASGQARDSSWAGVAQTAFLDGYTHASGFDPRSSPLLRILVLDKALYEVTYEARNRPDWLPIPLSQVLELAEAVDSDQETP